MSLQDELLQKYCPPLEEPLFFALASDFDLNDGEQRLHLEEILVGLKEQAVIEQELELAAPLATYNHFEATRSTSKTGTASSHQQTSRLGRGDIADSITTGLSDVQISSKGTESNQTSDADLPDGLEDASTQEQEMWLKALFPTIDDIQITETFARCAGDVQKSVDELLNLSFIHEDADENYNAPKVPKGIDGFVGRKQKKSRSKKNRRKYDREDFHVSDDSLPSGAITPSNVWRSAAEDVDFIVSRTNLSMTNVQSAYHQNNASLALTIKSLVIKEATANVLKIRNNDVLAIQASELKLELGAVADDHIYGALLLAQMIPSAAKDLIEAMMARPAELNAGRIVPQYTPIKLSEDEKTEKTLPASTVAVDPDLLASRAGVHSMAANQAFVQAQSAYRRGKSDRLMGGAAAYYAQVGHEERKRQKALMSFVADAHVCGQSSPNSLDLHGVTVEHAVRIAKGSVEAWWDQLGDQKYVVGGMGEGYKIIVGLGTHSAHGIGKIGPAVSKMLMREGWKVNVQRGEIFVEGKARR